MSIAKSNISPNKKILYQTSLKLLVEDETPSKEVRLKINLAQLKVDGVNLWR